MNSTYLPTEKAKTRALVINALFIALTLVATMFINIKLPIMGNGGLIHLGNVPLFIAAFVYGKKTGAIAGALGMCFADLISPWAAWAPFTFIIVGAMGFLAGLISEKVPGKRELVYTLAVAVALIIKIVGYYFAEVILYGNWIQPIGSIPGNVMQVVIAGIIVVPLAGRLKKRAGQI
ncbi:ECF transporter S component [Peribacillus butanolivorans]|uniref:ECF transporter S component n=1 Tax=Peribacillus butanolivorans TaxID=421767 RepID=A0AAX0S9B3_9BACI|nr:ECF transporter S component [Peribacillus butanolivorans]AXN40958.1 ECF transporter S component [Peribacillus butanolivorans]PEJ36341.1 ECF transporter S component [Peribacillus butanolivorans]QNU05189.1 ECF transporter S component [Peribacillus butanolivorans]